MDPGTTKLHNSGLRITFPSDRHLSSLEIDGPSHLLRLPSVNVKFLPRGQPAETYYTADHLTAESTTVLVVLVKS